MPSDTKNVVDLGQGSKSVDRIEVLNNSIERPPELTLDILIYLLFQLNTLSQEKTVGENDQKEQHDLLSNGREVANTIDRFLKPRAQYGLSDSYEAFGSIAKVILGFLLLYIIYHHSSYFIESPSPDLNGWSTKSISVEKMRDFTKSANDVIAEKMKEISLSCITLGVLLGSHIQQAYLKVKKFLKAEADSVINVDELAQNNRSLERLMSVSCSNPEARRAQQERALQNLAIAKKLNEAVTHLLRQGVEVPKNFETAISEVLSPHVIMKKAKPELLAQYTRSKRASKPLLNAFKKEKALPLLKSNPKLG